MTGVQTCALPIFGLTEQQWRILRALGDNPGGLEPGALADVCQILKPSLTGILARMQILKLVARERSVTDQRRQCVTLTGRGQALIDRMTPVVDRQYRLLEEAIGARTLDTMYAALDAALVALERPVASAVDGADARAGSTARVAPRLRRERLGA